MTNIKQAFLNCLNDVKGSGKFVTTRSAPFLFPGLEIAGIGELAYPINEVQAKALIGVAHKAPFGRGSETVLDNKVRSVWEINADKLIFRGKQWADFMEKILTKIKPDLGVEDYAISAQLYKMLVYEKDDFFLRHKDSEKEKGMFGSLIIALPCRHEGGELVVSFDGTTEVINFAQDSNDYKISYAAFYADCDHELLPVTVGYRVCLVYNLIQEKAGKKIEPATVQTHALQLANILEDQKQSDFSKPCIVLLGHQYTPENFSNESLKLNDRHKAEILFSTAHKLGFYAKLCLVTSFKSGSPAYDGDYDDDNEDAEMEEVFDESLEIEYWAESEVPGISIDFQEEDLIASFALQDDEPIVKESTGYMGNYGPDINHWYHYGAVIMWSPETNAQLQPLQNAATQLEWINYFNKNYGQINNNEAATIETILSSGLSKTHSREKADYSPVADWIINTKDESFFLRQPEPLCQDYFRRIDDAHWLKLIAFFPAETTEKIFSLITRNVTPPVLGHILSVLRLVLTSGQNADLIKTQISKLPHYLGEVSKNRADEKHTVNSKILTDLFYLESQMPQDEVWVNNVAEIISGYNQRNYINHILTPEIIALPVMTAVARKALLVCKKNVEYRVNNQPQLLPDWSREVPVVTTGDKKQWQLLKDFLESPHQQVFDYRAKQNERTEMEQAISHVVIDLKIETIRKGSPHILRMTKTHAAYHRQMKDWNEDVLLLEKINKKAAGSA